MIEQYNAVHNGEGLVTFMEKLKHGTSCEPGQLAIAIEVAWGALVETLIENGFVVFSINPVDSAIDLPWREPRMT